MYLISPSRSPNPTGFGSDLIKFQTAKHLYAMHLYAMTSRFCLDLVYLGIPVYIYLYVIYLVLEWTLNIFRSPIALASSPHESSISMN